MEKKILHTFAVLNSLFSEARFVYKAPKKAPSKAEVPDEKKVETKPAIDEEKEKVKEESKEGKEKLKVGVEGKAERGKFKKEENLPETTGDVAKKTPVKLPESQPLASEDFIKVDLATQTNGLDWFRINGTRENSKMNAQTWDHSTKEGLQKIYQEFKDLGILGKDAKDRAYYDTMFAILNGAVNTSNPYLAENNGAYRPMFKSPTDGTSRETIEGLPKKGSFAGGAEYIRAFDALTMVRARLMVQDKKQEDTLKAQGKKGVDPIGTAAVDVVKSNISVLQKAAQDRDYATLGIYALGGYALWKTVGAKLFGGDDGHGGGDHGGGHGGFDFKKWALWGAALYGADKVLKNAGYDVLKMAGFKGMDAEVKGTPLESMKNILSQSQYSEEMKDLDYGIALTMSETKLTDLNKLMLNANKSGIHFIHPREFPALFPDMATVWPFKMGIGEGGLKDYIGMNNSKLSATEREYIRVGQQLYKMSMALPVIYEKTYYKDHKKYIGLTYEKMLEDPVRGTLKVRHLMEACGQYAPETVGGSLFSGKKPQEVEEKLKNGTGKVLGENGFTLDTSAELQAGSGHIAGSLKGFPIVVVTTKEGYRVYLQNDYGDKKGYNSTPGMKFTLIPLEGAGMERKAKEAVEKVDDRMAELMKKLKDGNNELGLLKYENGQWKTTIKFKGASDLGVAPKNDVEIPVTVDENGNTLRLNDGETSSEKYLERGVLGKIVEQREFKALNVFLNAKQLTVQDDTPGDGKVTLLIGANKTKIEFKYTGKFEIVGGTAKEKGLVQNQAFAQNYIDALDSDKQFELNKNLDKLKDQIQKAAPEGFVKHFFTALLQQNNKSAVSGFNLDTLSGSIPENFTNMVVGTSKREVLERLRRAILTSSSLEEVEKKRVEILQDFNTKIEGITRVITEENIKKDREGKKWDRDEFMSRVVDRVRKASCLSSTYSMAKSDFEYMAYSLPIPGFLTKKSDLGDASHNAVSELMGVFVYHTAHLDTEDAGGTGSGGVKKNLDNLDYPPKPTPGKAPADDTALRGHLTVRYFEYVKNQIYSKAKTMNSLSSIPPATAQNVWEIKDFETWAKTEGDYRPLDPLDSKPAFEHKPEVDHVPHVITKVDASGTIIKTTGVENTPLEKEMIKEFDEAVAILREEYPTELNFHAIDAYLRLKASDAGPDDSVGIFKLQRDPVTGKDTSQLWNWSESIGKNRKRSLQVREIQGLVDKFLIREIFENPAKYFTKKISIKTKILKRWPWVRDMALVPDWFNPFS